MRIALFTIVIVGIFAACMGGPVPRLTYKDVKPIFDKRCVMCHNPSNAKEGLNLSTYAGIIKGSRHGKVVLARKASKSKVIKLVSAKAKPMMPPIGPRLTAAEIGKLNAWIQSGAVK